MRLLRGVSRLFKLDRERRVYLRRALWFLILSRLAFALLPTRRILDRLQRGVAEKRRPLDPVDPRLVAWAVDAIAREVPWRSDCLIQAMAAALWLHRCGRQPRLHLGVRPSGQGSLEAHAWLSLDGKTIIGSTEAGDASFSAFGRQAPGRDDRRPPCGPGAGGRA